MKKIVSLLLSLMLIGLMGTALADTVDAGVVESGAQLTIKIDLTAVAGEAAVIGIVTNDAPVEFVSASGTSTNDTIAPNSDPNSGLKGSFWIVNMPNASFDGNGNPVGTDFTNAPLVTGHVANLTIKVSDTASAGTYTVGTKLLEGSSSIVVDGQVTFTVKSDRLPGDVDEDGDVDLVDIMKTANYIYVEKESYINLTNADVDADGSITLVDIMRIASIVYPVN